MAHVDNYVSVGMPRLTVPAPAVQGSDGRHGYRSFNGRIYVSQDARSKSYQRSNNILLTIEAKMYTKPQLEIYADDVKCSPGATVGQLDDNALFYLRSGY